MSSEPMLKLTGITKRFHGVAALQDVDFDLEAGEIHALFGENGAGKSTLIKLIVGTFPFDAGTYVFQGKTVRHLTPHKARETGIAAVFQEFSLVPDLTVVENLFLGREEAVGGLLRRSAMRRDATRLLDDLGFSVPLDAPVRILSRAQRQMVEISKALLGDARLLILDEPTASLTDAEAEKLFAAIGDLKARGIGIIYVSHRLAEIHRLADRVTILRNGEKIDTVRTSDVTDNDLIEMMVGQPVEEIYPEIDHKAGPVRLSVHGLSTADGTVEDASITVRGGEIVGLGGLVGCGRSELMRAIFGLDPITAGTIELDGRMIDNPKPRALLQAGLCYFPSDRGEEGLALNRSARENATMAALDLPDIAQFGLLRRANEVRHVGDPLRKLGLRPMAPEREAMSFSGGNQQKIMLARGLTRDVQVFLFDEPTVGIDVGAKAEVYALLKTLAENGAAVLVSSSELPELLHLSNRLYVMHTGQVTGELSGHELEEGTVLSKFFGELSGGAEARA